MLLSPLCLAFASVLGVTTPPVVITIPADTTQVPLTVDAINHMAAFWTAFVKEAPAVRNAGRKANHETVMLGISLNGQEMTVTAVNMVVMSQQFPSVAADLKASDLTAQQWEGYRKALLAASVADQIDKEIPPQAASMHSLPVWKDVEFIRIHKKEYDALVATGMWFPKLRVSNASGGGMGGGNDDLNP